MECIEARALKKSTFLSELAVNSSSKDSFDDEFVFMNGVSANDDFSVDGFFDFSNEDFVEEEEEQEKDFVLEKDGGDTWRICGGGEEAEVLPPGELSVPVDDMENLEWLSQIVDDSASELSLLCPAGNYTPKSVSNYIPKTGIISDSLNQIEPPVHTHTPVLCFPSIVPAKARTKRPRTGGRSWSGGSPETSGDCSPTSTLIFSNPIWNRFQVGFDDTDYSEEVAKPPSAKRGRKSTAMADGSGDASLLVQRRCSHCQVQKTPQWRNGPLGPKTLCNACGVRFKSGRLFPEYRPACSPTFLGDVHSNSHRKVLEMRRKKEVSGDGSDLVM